MAVYNSVFVLLVLVSLCSAHEDDWNPAAEDPRIHKQPPHHWGTPAPNSRVKLDFVPFRMLASVRHEQSTKHLPRSAALSTASTPAEVILAQRLKESITTKKLGEVYTEQGYEDKKYDHGYFDKFGKWHEKYENHDRGKFNKKNVPHDGAASSTVPKYYPKTYAKPVAQSSNTKETKMQYDRKKYPYYGTASKTSPIRYATNPELIPDKRNGGETPFYDSTNYKECPEITPDLTGKVGPDNKHPSGEPRLKGLGDKIDCLTSKYFGEDPFDNPFFKEDQVESITDNPAMLLPSASTHGPVLYPVNVTETKPRAKKSRPANVNLSPAASAPVASTEYVEGLLPPPLPRVKRGIEVYSTRRGGVKFTSTDLDSDGSDIDTARLVPPSHRVSAGNKFGARDSEPRRAASAPEGRSTRGRNRNYEVTEEPEDGPPASSRFPNRNAPPRRVHVEHHRVTKEEVFSSTYVPVGDDAGDVMTTTVWNAAPETEAFTPRSNLEQEVNSVEPQRGESDVTPAPRAGPARGARPRARPSVAAIREDAFEARGEKRKVEAAEKSNSDILRSRSRSRSKTADKTRAEPAFQEVTTQEPQEAFIIPTESIPQNVGPTESYEIPTERAPTAEKSTRQRPVNNESFKIPTEKIPEARQVQAASERRTRPSNTVPAPEGTSERRPRPPVFANAVPIPVEGPSERRPRPPPIPNAVPAPVEGHSERRSRPPPIPNAVPVPIEGPSERRSRPPPIPNAVPVPIEGPSERRSRPPPIPNAVPVPVEGHSERRQRPQAPAPVEEDSPAERPTSRRQGATSRSKSGRLEAIRGRKQDYSARIPSDDSRHTSRSRVTESAPEQPTRTSTRQRSRVNIDPVENAEQPDTSRRVNRQGSRGSRRNSETVVSEQRLDAAPAPSRRSSLSRRPSPAFTTAEAAPQPEVVAPNAASSTRRGRPSSPVSSRTQDAE